MTATTREPGEPPSTAEYDENGVPQKPGYVSGGVFLCKLKRKPVGRNPDEAKAEWASRGASIDIAPEIMECAGDPEWATVRYDLDTGQIIVNPDYRGRDYVRPETA